MGGVLVYLGSALMLFNIMQYAAFARHIRKKAFWTHGQALVFAPTVLLVLFLAGYLAVGIFGRPDLVVGGILFGGSVFVAVMLHLVKTVTQQIEEKEHLEAALSASEQANKAKTFFLSNMSHDIRTPLNAIIGFTNIAMRDGISPEETRSYLAKIQRSGNQLLALINDVLDMTRIESGKMELEPVAMDLLSVLCEAQDVFSSQMEEKGIAFEVSSEPLQNQWVFCDKNRLQRALFNLLSNACKFTPEGGQVELHLRQTGAADGSASYELIVRDTGIGMSREFAEQVFNPFEHERTSTVSKIQGTGLGMSITKSIVDLMHGKIAVETAPGQGTVFTISLTFPTAEPVSGQEKPLPCACRDKPAPGSVRLLLAEDNEVNREIAEFILRECGYLLDEVENGRQAVERIKEAEPGYYAAVLMDIQMPEMDGYEATRIIRALPDPGRAAVPIIAMTANAFREDVEQAKAAGMDGHIAKPLDVDKMLETLREVLGGPGGAA